MAKRFDTIGLITSPRQWRDRGMTIGFPHRALFEGLKRIGCQPVVASTGPWPVFDKAPSAAFLWNGTKSRWKKYAENLRRMGTTVFVMEHGWFSRRKHIQIDHESFAHSASWATRDLFNSPAPPQGKERFGHAYGSLPKPLKSAKIRKGYILILLQVPGDSQMRHSQINSPDPLVKAVLAAAPPGVEIRVRAHPSHDWNGSRIIEGTLADAIKGAAFCITINSGAGIDSLIMGCPVLCLGPAMYSTAKVALRTTLADMRRNIKKMLDGWRPTTKAVHNFLYHLACRQWSLDEIAQGNIIKNILEKQRLKQ